MAWAIEYGKDAEKEIAKLDRQSRCETGESAQHWRGADWLNAGDYWKYRVGDYRIIAEIQDAKLIVQVVRVGNRREVYR